MTSTIFLYEYVTGGGTFSASPPTVPTGSWLREGAAMISALAADFLTQSDTRVVLLRDARLKDVPLSNATDFALGHGEPQGASRGFLASRCGQSSPAASAVPLNVSGLVPSPANCVVEIGGAEQEWAALRRLAREADWTLLIAPECNRTLLDRCRAVEAAGGRLLSPNSAFIAWASDKHRCAQRLIEAGVSAPIGIQLRPGEPLPHDFCYPAVVKPCDGAGSQGVQWVANADAAYDASELGTHARLERWYPGLAASVAVLCGPRQMLPLPACRQCLTDDGRFGYLGGETPLSESLSQRAQRLALAAVQALPATIGYVGVDLVLGEPADGQQDVVVEINPRLTTSYVGLRQLATTNLAVAMLGIAEGRPTELSFATHFVQFGADGRVAIRGTLA